MLSDQAYNSLQASQVAILDGIRTLHDKIVELEEQGPPPPNQDRTAATYVGGTCTSTQVNATSFLGQTGTFSVSPWANLTDYTLSVVSLNGDIPAEVHYDPLMPSTIQVRKMSLGSQMTFSQPFLVGSSLSFFSGGSQIRPYISTDYQFDVLNRGVATNDTTFTNVSTILAPLANMSRIYQYVTHTPANFFSTMVTDSGILRYPRTVANTPCLCTRQILFTLKKGMYYAVTASFFWTGDFPYFRELELAVYLPTSATTPGSESVALIRPFYGRRNEDTVGRQSQVSVCTPPRIFLANSDNVFINLAGYYDLKRDSGTHYCTGLITVVQI